MQYTKSPNIRIIIAVVLLVLGMITCWVSLFLPPMGVIDNSVLYLFANISTLSGALMGVEAFIRKTKDS